LQENGKKFRRLEYGTEHGTLGDSGRRLGIAFRCQWTKPLGGRMNEKELKRLIKKGVRK